VRGRRDRRGDCESVTGRENREEFRGGRWWSRRRRVDNERNTRLDLEGGGWRGRDERTRDE
ncbi:hypothetical protein HAX54_017230, partial [Datura stramonium]|nr:hypothetical protein [Datura stramonium]